ncbi:hypothetical protein U4E84_00895 [Halorubrum sp. AD140]|uniref:hypothetical protein n=1 Tax=Halorubrum sp. AD140 TaxID=3050073 RepID=UPI002ACC8370|nr:hypothetical protein [Halorubrum sp. AD140]MDZ5809910.1 hypothetical protein [Halorubrum sp. AD140]
MSRRRTPGREGAAARSGERRTWYGYGELTRVEKSRLGVFLHDTTRLFAEISVVSLPVLLLAMEHPPSGWFDAKATGLVAWIAAVVTATLVRGGFVRPLATATPGWVTLSPSLLLARIPYFNGGLALAIFGGLGVERSVATVVPDGALGIVLGLTWAAGVAVLLSLSFPRVAERWLSVVG